MDEVRESESKIGNHIYTTLGGVVRSACPDCGKPNFTNLLRCAPCDEKAERESIPMPMTEHGWHTGMVDKGCEYAPSCLRCPFEICKHDKGGRLGKRGMPVLAKRTRIMELHNGGTSARAIARDVGLSVRTIGRALNEWSRES